MPPSREGCNLATQTAHGRPGQRFCCVASSLLSIVASVWKLLRAPRVSASRCGGHGAQGKQGLRREPSQDRIAVSTTPDLATDWGVE